MIPLPGGSARANTIEADRPRRSALALLARTTKQSGVQRLLLLLICAAAVPRLILLPLNENLYGDAVSRTELAARGAPHPHWISSLRTGPFNLARCSFT